MDKKMIDLVIADDQVIFLEKIAKFFVKRGYNVSKATTGKDAYDLAVESDVGIFDIDIPSPSGLEVSEKLSKNAPNVHRILISGVPEMQEKAKKIKSYDAFFEKPIQFTDLEMKISRVDLMQKMPLNRVFKKLSIHVSNLSESLATPKSDVISLASHLRSITEFAKAFFWSYDKCDQSSNAVKRATTFLVNALRGLSFVPSIGKSNYTLIMPTVSILNDILLLINATQQKRIKDIDLAVDGLIDGGVPILPEFGSDYTTYCNLIEEEEEA